MMLNKNGHIVRENLPLFPLGIIVLPGETRFLHIFEKRYKNLFDDLGKFESKFGIPFVINHEVINKGSLVKLERVLARYPNGEIDIAVKGIDIISINNYKLQHPERAYPYGDIETLSKDKIAPTQKLLNAFERYNEKILKLNLKQYPKVNFYLIANSIGLSDIEKYHMLTSEDEAKINKTLLNHLRLRTILAQQHKSVLEHYCLN